MRLVAVSTPFDRLRRVHGAREIPLGLLVAVMVRLWVTGQILELTLGIAQKPEKPQKHKRAQKPPKHPVDLLHLSWVSRWWVGRKASDPVNFSRVGPILLSMTLFIIYETG